MAWAARENDVRLEHIDGHWTVFVYENGETAQSTYEMKEWAENFAEGQRLRLGLPPGGEQNPTSRAGRQPS